MSDSAKRRPTIADVARRAGVSSAAVSFAVNDRPGVSTETRERILAVVRELGWQPSASARALTEARTRAVGWVLARTPEELEADAFFVRFLAGLEATLTAADYALLLQIAPDAEVARAAFERLAAAGRADAYLITDEVPTDPRVPVVVVGRAGDLPRVDAREDEGMAALVAHLVALGHERISFVGGGPREADFVAAAGERAVEDGTAIVCATDALALELLAGRPDVAVAGFGDTPAAAAAGLTSVRVDHAGLGAAAGALLLAEIAGEPAPVYSLSPPEVMARGSTERRRRR